MEAVTVVLCWEDVTVVWHWEVVSDALNSELVQVPDSWPSYCSCAFQNHMTLAAALVVYLMKRHWEPQSVPVVVLVWEYLQFLSF